MQELERHADPREFPMHPVPVRLLIDTLMLTAAGEQACIHGGSLEIGDLVPAETFPLSGIDHRHHGMPRHALRRDLPRRESLRSKPKHQLRPDLPHHENH